MGCSTHSILCSEATVLSVSPVGLEVVCSNTTVLGALHMVVCSNATVLGALHLLAWQ